jgi:4-methylaminobutanoate oxidase (formaldehyde-forming)
LVEAGRGGPACRAQGTGQLRTEKGYATTSHDIDNTDTVLEAGLGFAVADKPGGFIGRDAVLVPRRRAGADPAAAQVLLADPEPPMPREGGAGTASLLVHRSASYGFPGGAIGWR